MQAPNNTSINNRIALAKGWTIDKNWLDEFTSLTCPNISWYNSKGKRALRPDYVGTLKGVSGMMRELNEHAKAQQQYWVWGQNAKLIVDAPRDAYYCAKFNAWTGGPVKWFWSPDDRPGDCVGEAYMSVKEATDDSTTD